MLFRTGDIKDYSAPQRAEARAMAVDVEIETMLLKRNDDIAKVLPPLRPDVCIHYASGGVWSMHELVFHLLSLIGPARMTFATWSISEDPIRKLIQAIDAGILISIEGIMDFRVPIRTPGVYNLAKNQFTNIRLTACHAKIAILQNEAWSVSVVGSPNFTRNPRIEAGTITVSQRAAQFHRENILAELENAHPFD